MNVISYRPLFRTMTKKKITSYALFKKGFSGQLTEFCGEFEKIYKPVVNVAVNTGMKTMRSVRHANFVRKTKGKGPEKGQKSE